MKPAVVGIAGPELLPEEAALFKAHPPAGIILFARNIHDPRQLRALMDSLPSGTIRMVDQEGGRVARLRPPHWLAHPPAGVIGALPLKRALRAAWLTGALIGLDCRNAGFTTVAAPVLDLLVPDAHIVIGDRSSGPDPLVVARLGRSMAAGLLAAGVEPVGKHAPGHGRAMVDSHLSLPIVDANTLAPDFTPFALNIDLPWLMTAHIVYPMLDPIYPATLSHRIITEVIRGQFGFRGLLVTDDLAMHALQGAPAERAVAALAAGCDIALYCAGDFAATEAVLTACPDMSPPTARRLAAARDKARRRRQPLDANALAAERARIMG